MDLTVNRPDLFPDGTVIGVWRSDEVGEEPTEPPLQDRSVKKESATFTGLEAGIDYVVGAEVNGQWRLLRYGYTTGPGPFPIPTGAASGVLAGSFPNPEFSQAGFDSIEAELGLSDPAGAVQQGAAPFVIGRLRLRDEWSAKDFGALLNGDDETTILQTAIAEARAAGKRLYIPEGVAAVTASLTDSADQSPCTIRGAGKGLTILEHAVFHDRMFKHVGTADAGYGVVTLPVFTAPASIGDSTITIDDTSGLEVGQLVDLRDPGVDVEGGSDSDEVDGGSHRNAVAKAGETMRIRSIDSPTQITFYGRLNWAYAVNSDVRPLTMIDGLHYSGFTILNTIPGTNNAAGIGLAFTRCVNVSVDEVGFELLDGPGVALTFANGWRVKDCDFKDMREDTTNAYGIIANQSASHGLVKDNIADHGRHLFTTGGDSANQSLCPQHILVAANVVKNHPFTALDTHPGARFITFLNNLIHNNAGGTTGNSNGSGIHARGPDCKIIGNVVIGANDGIGFIDGADRGIARANVLRNCNKGIRINDSDAINIDGNDIENPLVDGIIVDAQTTAWADHMQTLDIDNTRITGTPSDAGIKQTTANRPVRTRIGPGVKIPGATTKITGVDAVQTVTAAATLGEPS